LKSNKDIAYNKHDRCLSATQSSRGRKAAIFTHQPAPESGIKYSIREYNSTLVIRFHGRSRLKKGATGKSAILLAEATLSSSPPFPIAIHFFFSVARQTHERGCQPTTRMRPLKPAEGLFARDSPPLIAQTSACQFH